MTIYLTNDNDLTSVANAIRTKSGTSSSLVYPTGFVTAINNISDNGSGGSSSWEDFTGYEVIGTFSGNVATDGHLCVIVGLPDEVNGNFDLGGTILEGLPSPPFPVFFEVSQLGYDGNFLIINEYGTLEVGNLDIWDPSAPFVGFTFVYPIASS